MRVPGVGMPRQVIAAGLAALEHAGLRLDAVSPIIDSDPLGPSRRRFANAAAAVVGSFGPPSLLILLKRIEREFGRRRRGPRWQARPLDIDIILWSGGIWGSPTLTIPHREFRRRDFVLEPAATIAPAWRDPVSGRSLRQLRMRLTAPRPLPR